MPIDESQNPYGIQTDIIGTVGSSGSAIINADTGVVLGIAQKILPAEISIPEQTAKLVWHMEYQIILLLMPSNK